MSDCRNGRHIVLAWHWSLQKPIGVSTLLLAMHVATFAADHATLTSLQAVHDLSNEQANKALPASFQATVVYSRGYEQLLFVQDGNSAFFVQPPSTAQWTPGDRILISGRTQGSFRPLVLAAKIELLHHGNLPRPASATWREMIQARLDSRLVSVHAKVRAADIVVSAHAAKRSARLELLMDGGHLEASLDSDDEAALKDLMDCEVEITGVAAGKFDDKMQQTGIVLYVSKLEDVMVLERAATNPWSLPLTPMDQILGGSSLLDRTERVRVDGVITYYQPGSAVVLENGAKSLWISTESRDPLEIGDFAEATGFPSAHDRLLTLTDGEIKDSHIRTAVEPLRASWGQLAAWNSNRPIGHQNDLVSIEGQAVAEVREASQDEYVLSSDGQLFTAIYRHPRAPSVLLPMRQVPLGSRVRVTGICTVLDTHAINPGEDVAFDILLRSFDDIAIVANPSMLSVRNLLLLIGFLVLLLLLGGTRSWIVERRVRRQNAAVAYLERRRARILEEINGSAPLAEILEHVAELVSFKFCSVPCWFQIADGARLGNCPPKLTGFRVAQNEIRSRTGQSLGTIFAALDPRASKRGNEMESLSMGAAMASLAIETRRLYSDLVHRSEFDLLTEIHNRFSLEKFLEQQIERMRDCAGIFGLIYIDLNDFKHVNDFYGHLVGDLYLREVASRLKRQLRDRDMLARLGGDEFAVLVGAVHNRSEVQEIARRLVHAFDAPFEIEGYALEGSASIGIAMYPEDGQTKDSLLSAADGAMYVEKQMKNQTRNRDAKDQDRKHGLRSQRT